MTTKKTTKTTQAPAATLGAAPRVRKSRAKAVVVPSPTEVQAASVAAAEVPVAGSPAPAAESQITVAGPIVKKKDLVDRVTAMSGAKKRDVKLIVEATLQVLGDALSKGEELNLPPFGKAKVNRQRDLAQGEMMVVKIRRGG